MNSNSGKVHKETGNIFEKHPKLNTSRKGKQIAKELDDLRTYRNLVDYDAEKPKNINNTFNYCKSRCKIIFKLLDELKFI